MDTIMKEKDIRNALRDYDKVRVDLFISYLNSLKKEKWYRNLTTPLVVDLFKKVAIDGVFIDGENVLFTYRGKITVSYNYKAYKSIMLNYYPESIIDLQLVYDGDTFSFEKIDGKVHYKHSIGNPFSDMKKIIGSYCIVKNKRGEFIEVLNMSEIKKIRNTASTQAIWNTWEGEMIKKSNIKRICKNFADKFANVEQIDNQNYNPENAGISSSIQELISDCESEEDLQRVYERFKEEIAQLGEEATFIALLGDRKLQLKATV